MNRFGYADDRDSEYVRGKIQERTGVIHPHPIAKFTPRGNDVWAARSGRTYYGGQDDTPSMEGSGFSSPVTGNGMGSVGRLVGGRTHRNHEKQRGKKHDEEHEELEEEYEEKSGGARYLSRGSGLAELQLLKGSAKHSEPKRRNARADIVRKVMHEKGLKMIEASKYVKQHGLY